MELPEYSFNNRKDAGSDKGANSDRIMKLY